MKGYIQSYIKRTLAHAHSFSLVLSRALESNAREVVTQVFEPFLHNRLRDEIYIRLNNTLELDLEKKSDRRKYFKNFSECLASKNFESDCFATWRFLGREFALAR